MGTVISLVALSPHQAPLAVVALGFAAACVCILAMTGSGSPRGTTELVAKAGSAARPSRQVLRIAQQLERHSVSQSLALQAGKTLSTIESLCGGGATGTHAAAMDRYRKRADHNWWAAIHAFATEDEVKAAVMNDPRHVHLLVFVAPGWCSWSQKELKELQENFDDFGEAADRVHLIDVDDPANKQLVQFEGVTSFPTIVVVQGNNILGKANGFKDFDTMHDIAFVDTEGVPFDQSFPV